MFNHIRNWKIFSRRILAVPFSERLTYSIRRNLSDLYKLLDYWLLAA